MRKAPGSALTRSSTRRQRGLALVEVVLVLPVALILMMATAEVGRALMEYNALNKALREGARYVARTATLGSTGIVQIDAPTRTATNNLIVYGNTQGTGSPRLTGLRANQITLAAAASGSVSLTAAYPYQPLFLRIPGFTYGNDVDTALTLQAGVVTRAL
jgi:Flp pilus assembly protein TadG